jgi:hypothetical protein
MCEIICVVILSVLLSILLIVLMYKNKDEYYTPDENYGPGGPTLSSAVRTDSSPKFNLCNDSWLYA